MQVVTVNSVKDVKQGQYGLSSKIVTNDGEFFVNEDATARIGKTFEVEVIEKTSAQNRQYKIAKFVKEVVGQATQGSTGQRTLTDFVWLATEAHNLALKLEPDGVAVGETETGGEAHTLPIVTIDRSQARARIVNTFVIAFSNGKIAIPDDNDIPF